VKRCGKSAPRVRQRNRHGKPHREQDRIGTATRGMFACKSDNTAGRCQARRPGRLLEATCKRCPRGMAVTYRLREQAVPYKTRLTGRLMPLRMRGSAQTRRTPRQFRPILLGCEFGTYSGVYNPIRADPARSFSIPDHTHSLSRKWRSLEKFRAGEVLNL